MKLRPRDFAGFLARKPGTTAGLLIHGDDAGAVHLRREEALAALVGPPAAAEADMRLTRIDPDAIRSDPALLQDAQRARGFFPGPRAVLVDGAGNGLADAMKAALASARPDEDAALLVTAGSLRKDGALRKAFEAHPAAGALQVFTEPPGRAEIAAMLARGGVPRIEPGAEAELDTLARQLDPAGFADLVERLSLYKLNDRAPLSAAEVAACAPQGIEAEVDEAVEAVAQGRVAALGPTLSRVAAGGVDPVTLCLAMERHFRGLHAAAVDPAGPEAALTRQFGPAWNPRKEAMAAQAGGWGATRLETALRLLTDTDLTLRSASAAPSAAVLERALLRIAMLRNAR